MKINMNIDRDTCIYVAQPHFLEELKRELANAQIIDDLIFAKSCEIPVIFALDTWYDPKIISIESIGDAVRKLKSIQPFWYPHPIVSARRTILIAEQLPQLKKIQKIIFPVPDLPNIGAFTLIDQKTLLYATKRDKKIPDGRFDFVEDKVNPPNRAYLKLWEALAILNRYPKQGDFALDLGASPGGWTYVLQNLGAKVLAVDKSPLAPNIARLRGVEFQEASAFSLRPQDFSAIDWFVCDVACYPERLYKWLLPWIESGKVKQFIVTIKLQGKTDFKAIAPFQKIPGGRVMHLYHNKHEVTFFYPFHS